jgi:hypothetical protein
MTHLPFRVTYRQSSFLPWGTRQTAPARNR